VMLQLREQAMHAIESGRPTGLYFAEWSPPPTVLAGSKEALEWANPALGHTISLQALEAASDTPDRQAFLRAHCNTWVSAAGAWLPHGLWERLAVDEPIPAGGILSVDTSLDDLRYVGVRAVQNGDRVHVRSEFVVESAQAMWNEISRVLADPAVRLAITPGLADIAPPEFERRITVVGMAEMYKYTGIVRSLIAENRVIHNNQVALSEHVCRAVAARAQNAITLSSQKSPGPIELARCMVWAVGLAAKPVAAVRRPAFGIAQH
jgi:phage terminase large subunit-like protein